MFSWGWPSSPVCCDYRYVLPIPSCKPTNFKWRMRVCVERWCCLRTSFFCNIQRGKRKNKNPKDQGSVQWRREGSWKKWWGGRGSPQKLTAGLPPPWEEVTWCSRLCGFLSNIIGHSTTVRPGTGKPVHGAEVQLFLLTKEYLHKWAGHLEVHIEGQSMVLHPNLQNSLYPLSSLHGIVLLSLQDAGLEDPALSCSLPLFLTAWERKWKEEPFAKMTHFMRARSSICYIRVLLAIANCL